jgi:PAS domain S-box-containing protein
VVPADDDEISRDGMTAVRAAAAPADPASALRQSKARFRNLTAATFEGLCITQEGRITEVNEQFAAIFRCRREDVIGQEVSRFVHPDSRTIVAERIRDGTEGAYEHRAVRPDGTSFDVEVQAKLIKWGGQLVRLSAVRDITERKRTDTALRESQERLDLIFQNTADMLILYAVDEVTSERLELRLLTANRAFLEGAARVGYPLKLESIRGKSYDAVMRDTFERDQASILASKAQVRAAIESGHPMSWEDGTADYALERTEIPIFGPDGRCRFFLRVLHDVTEQKRTQDALRESEQREQQARMDFTRKLIAFQEAELRRIASELHDSLGQNLLLIKNRTQLAQQADPAAGGLAEQLAGIVRLAGDAIAEVRQISHDLRPYQLDQLGLTRALRAMIDAAAEATQIVFEVKLEPVDEAFSADNAIHLYRIVQESLNNILKHAGASRVRVLLERDLHEVRLQIEDDGRGLAQPEAGAAGFGLRNMAERVLILGGQLTLGPVGGKGLGLRVVIPISETA